MTSLPYETGNSIIALVPAESSTTIVKTGLPSVYSIIKHPSIEAFNISIFELIIMYKNEKAQNQEVGVSII